MHDHRQQHDGDAEVELRGQLALLAEGAQTSAAIGHDPSWADDARAAAESLIDFALDVRAAPHGPTERIVRPA